jgi:hypothetical protein
MPYRFVQEEEQMTTPTIRNRAPLVAALIILACLSGGCAADHSTQRQVAEALQQKEEASIRLAKAITSYCSAHTDRLDARHTCIAEQRLLLLHSEEPMMSFSPSPLAGMAVRR